MLAAVLEKELMGIQHNGTTLRVKAAKILTTSRKGTTERGRLKETERESGFGGYRPFLSSG